MKHLCKYPSLPEDDEPFFTCEDGRIWIYGGDGTFCCTFEVYYCPKCGQLFGEMEPK